MTLYKKEFKLEAHPYLNIAYYLDDSLKPILLDKAATKSVTEYQTGAKPSFNQAPQETNTTESYPNALKVSATSNPMYFPIENTYQVGAAEIVAMMSNAVSVGVGQTGSAPLYVFCKDGVYAMFVDETGEMTYTNSRIIARDVCNNARSVTPIDPGVVHHRPWTNGNCRRTGYGDRATHGGRLGKVHHPEPYRLFQDSK